MKSKKIFLSVLCLILAFVTGLFASNISTLFSGNNSFELIMGTLPASSDEVHYNIPFDNSDGDNHLISYMSYQGEDYIGLPFNFDVKCSGNNIKSITYTADYAKFTISNTYYGDIKINGRVRGVESKTCSSFTVDYDNQPSWNDSETSAHPITLLIDISSAYSGRVGSFMLKEAIKDYYNYFMHSEGREYDDNFNIKTYNLKENLEYLYEEMFYGTNVEVEVTYNDGTVESKKIEITYDPEKSSYEKFDPYVIYNID